MILIALGANLPSPLGAPRATLEAALAALPALGLTVVRSLVGNYCTSLDMAGVSVSLTRLDAEMIALWDAPVRTAALRWGT